MTKLFRIFLTFLALLLFLPASIPASAFSGKEKAGAQLFRDKGCTYCHGANAQGTQKGPSLIEIRKKLNATQITNQIENGGQRMPSFSDSLSNDEVAQLVAFLRARHRPAIPPPAPAPVSNPGQ